MENLIIDAEFRALIPALSPEERGQLEMNLIADGCRDPLVVWDGILVDGHNRYEICKQNDLSFETTKICLPGRDAAKVWIIRNQFGRRNLTPYTRAELVLTLESIISVKAKKNLKTHTEQGYVNSRKAVHVDVELAKTAGVGEQIVHRARIISEKADDATKARLRSGEVSVNQAYKKIKQEEKQQKKAAQVDAISKEPPPIPAGPFRVVVVDPPWSYGSRAEDPTHRASNPYPSMSLDEIKALPVADISAPDSVLWLWTTNAHMPHVFDILSHWGFQHKTILTWRKDRMGTGDWLRGQTEHCILAVKGRPLVTLTNQTTALDGPLKEHSRKPESFYMLVESLCPGSKCELFSRTEREGWTTHGDETAFFSRL